MRATTCVRFSNISFVSKIIASSRSSPNGVLFHEPYFIVAIKLMESTPSELTEYVLYYMVRLRRSVRLA